MRGGRSRRSLMLEVTSMEGSDSTLDVARRPSTAAVNLLWPVKCTELVAVRVAHVGQIHRAKISLAQARRLFDRGASMSNRSVVELLHLRWRTALEPDGPAVGDRCRF